jgi:pimeloyl-ACP methyl ester carboxylesterase
MVDPVAGHDIDGPGRTSAATELGAVPHPDLVRSTVKPAPPCWPNAPAARLEVLPGTAHLPHLEAHPSCLAAITAFLSEI